MEKPDVILKTKNATLWYYPTEKIVHHCFHHFICDQEFRDVLNAGLAIFKEKKAQKWVSDDGDNSALKPEDKKWAEEVWSVEVVKAGWKYWAVRKPTKVTGQWSIRDIIKAFSDMGVKVQAVESAEEGLEWIKAQPEIEPDKPKVV